MEEITYLSIILPFLFIRMYQFLPVRFTDNTICWAYILLMGMVIELHAYL